MSIYKMEFEAAQHEEFGSYGLRVVGRDDFDPLMAVAHDVLEHFPDDDKTLAGECQALGASLWIRGISGYYQRNGNINPPPRHVATDISRFMLEMYSDHKDYDLPHAPRAPVHADGDWRELLGWCEEIKRYIVEDWRDELEGFNLSKADLPELRAYLPSIIRWLKIGFHKARSQRYKGYNPSNIAGLFDQIDRAAAQLDLDYMSGNEAKFIVELDLENLRVNTRVEYWYDNEEE